MPGLPVGGRYDRVYNPSAAARHLPLHRGGLGRERGSAPLPKLRERQQPKGSPVQGELAAGRSTEGLETCRDCPLARDMAGFTTPPPLRGTSPYTGEAPGKGAAKPATLPCFYQRPSGHAISNHLPCSPAPAGEKAVVRWPHPQVQGRSPGRRPPHRNGGPFSFPFRARKGKTFQQAAVIPVSRAVNQPLRGCAPPPPLHRGGFPQQHLFLIARRFLPCPHHSSRIPAVRP